MEESENTKKREVWNEEAADLSASLERSIPLGRAWLYPRCNVLQGMWSLINVTNISFLCENVEEYKLFKNWMHDLDYKIWNTIA